MNFIDKVISFIVPQNRRQVGAFWLLLPSIILMIGVFLLALVVFSKYSLFGFSGGVIIEEFQLETYTKFLFDRYYWEIVGRTVMVATLVTFFCLVLSYPVAYFIAKQTNRLVKELLIFIVFVPLLVSVIVRSYGWLILLSKEGLVNWLLLKLSIIDEPLSLAYNLFGVVIALVQIFLPFMVLPIMNVLATIDPKMKQASYDLGASKLRTFCSVTFPLSIKGVGTGVQIVFLLCLTAFATPALIGGGRVMTLPTFIYQRTIEVNWPMAAVASLLLIVISIVFIVLLNWFIESRILARIVGGSSK